MRKASGSSAVLGACILLVLLLAERCRGIITMAKSELEYCTDTGDQSSLKCKKKILISLAVPPDENENAAEAYLARVKDPENRDGNRDLENTLIINIFKTNVFITYNLEYVQGVCGDPYERYAVSGKSGKCRPGNNWKATCGVIEIPNSGGKLVDGSSGFCCRCEGLTETKDFRGLSKPKGCGSGDYRGYAYCLRFGEMRFNIFRVREGSITFQIKVKITNQTKKTEKIVLLSPQRKTGVDDTRTLIATIVGDVIPYTMVGNLLGKLLNIPENTGPNGNWASFTQGSPRDDARFTLALDEHRYGLGGQICDRIGINCVGFNNQPHKCTGRVGMCVAEQMIDFLREDKKAFDARRQPVHSVLKYGTNRGSWQKDSYSLGAPPTNTIMTLEVAADFVGLRRNKAPGKILVLNVPKFEALSTEGKMELEVTNIGKLDASFSFSIECDTNIKPIEAQTFTMAPDSPKKFQFNIYTIESAASTDKCTVRLLNSEAEETDAVEVCLTTTATVRSNGTQLAGFEVHNKGNGTFKAGLFGSGGLLGKIGGGIGGLANSTFGLLMSPFKAIFWLFGGILGSCE